MAQWWSDYLDKLRENRIRLPANADDRQLSVPAIPSDQHQISSILDWTSLDRQDAQRGKRRFGGLWCPQ
jgi:hypothetical protein